MPTPRRSDPMRRPLRWLAGAAALAIMPKCVLCLLAYVGAGAVTFGRLETCGGSESDALRSVISWLGIIAGGLCLLRLGMISRGERGARKG
jgi:hypothetical protein